MQYLDQNSPQLINESYKIWKKNVPSLYNILQTYELQSCSQSIQWLNESYIDNTWKCTNLLVGTNSISNNAVYVLNVNIPTDESLVDVGEYSQQRPQMEIAHPGYVGTMGVQNVDIKTTLYQDSQVMKMRVNKADSTIQNLLAVKTGGSNPQLIIYNLTLPQQQQQQQKLYLTGHQAQGYGLAWNNTQANVLASCSYDKKLLVYDIAQGKTQPLREIQTNQLLQQVKWMCGGNNNNKNILCTASQSKTISLYDLREFNTTNKPTLTKLAHNGEIYALDFNKYAQNLLLSGGEDGDVYLWDVRNMSKKFSSFVGHNDAITALQWSPFNPTRFVSSSADRKVVVWDVSQVQAETVSSLQLINNNTNTNNNNNNKQSPNNNNNNNKVQQISFIHNGHRSKVTDVSFSCLQQNLIASCQQNNVLQVWQMTDRFWCRDSNNNKK